ncbi:MAG: penicillin acylase family protein, partial [Abditibacteriales bacterium]|nr:penicillin acylase family protein [Abditibacteriales bacterium]
MYRTVIAGWLCLIFISPSLSVGLPKRQTLNVAGEEVLIVRDDFGVPHIYAKTERGLFFANGYAIAQDRLFQMEKYRRAAKGTTAEALGASGVDADREVRIQGYTDAERQKQFAALPADAQLMLQAYADGVNAWAQEATEKGRLPAEMRMAMMFTGLKWQPWQPTDTLAIIQMMARRFGGGGGGELRNLRLLEQLKAQHGEQTAKKIFDDLFFRNDPASPVTVPNDKKRSTDFGGGLNGLYGSRSKGNRLNPLPQSFDSAALDRAIALADWHASMALARREGLPTQWGSYGWVVAPKKSASGKAMLVGGPQMGFMTPQIAHEVHLSCPRFNVIGMGFAGVPGVLIGYNDHLAWTTTTAVMDCEDIFVEKLNPDNPRQYWHKGKWRDMEHRVEVIKVRGQADVRLDVYRTVHGPVLEIDEKNHVAYAKAMTYWNREHENLHAFRVFNRAKSMREFFAGARRLTTAHNFLVATKSGDIGYWFCGRYPLRAPGYDPRLPVPGTGAYEWRGVMKFNHLPHSLNPKQGYLCNWNNKPAMWWDNSDTPVWGAIFRLHRIQQLLEAKPKLTFEDMRDIVEDIGTYDLTVDYFKPLILRATGNWETGKWGDGDSSDLRRLKEAVRYLREWNHHGRGGEVGKTIYDAWLAAMSNLVFADDLGDLSRSSDFRRAVPSFLLHALLGKQSSVPHRYDFLNGKDADSVIVEALRQGVAKLTEERGEDMGQWGYRRGTINLNPLPPLPE